MYLLKRKKVFHFFYHDEYGKLKSVSTKCTLKSEANKFVIHYLEELKNKKAEQKNYSLEKYESFYKSYASTRFTVSYQEFLTHAFKQFQRSVPPSKMIRDIKAIDVERFIQLKKSEAGERIINGYLRSLQGAFERAVEFGLLEKNVFKEIKKLKPKENPPLFFTKAEFDKLLEFEKSEQMRLLYRVAVYSGMRMGEIRFLKWSSIDFENSLIKIHNHEEFSTKSKKSRIVPLHSSLKEDLMSHKTSERGYVFMNGEKMFTKDLLSERFKRAVRNAELNEKYHFHTLGIHLLHGLSRKEFPYTKFLNY